MRFPIRLAGWVLPLALLGCGDDFAPISLIEDLRVLALISDPLEVGPADPVRLTPVVAAPAAGAFTHRWSFCPFSPGSGSGFACALPSCETELAAEADGSTEATPGALALACLAAAGGGGASGIPAEIPDQVEVLFRYRVSEEGGTDREAVFRLPLYTQAAPAPRNRAPVIREVRLGGAPLVAGEPAPAAAPEEERELIVSVDPGSLDTFTDAAGQERTEEAVVSVFTTAGRFDTDSALGPDARVTWTATQLPPEATQAMLWAVARDLRGGQAVAGPFTIPLTP